MRITVQSLSLITVINMIRLNTLKTNLDIVFSIVIGTAIPYCQELERGENYKMGSPQSYPGLTEDVLEDYTTLTYLNKGEILHLMKKFYSIDPPKLEADPNHRFHMNEIMAKFDAIKNNPFRDRIFRVFSSKGDECFSFEDLLDFCSVMRWDCPTEVKAEWAFRIFDIDEDKQISEMDICEILDRLTTHGDNRESYLDQPSKEHIAKVIVKEMNLDSTGTISLNEFKLILPRIPEFASAFYLRL